MPMPAKKLDPKPCAICGRPMERKRINGRLEDVGVFRRRRHCSLSCANSRTEVTRSGASQRARRLRGPRCEVCGATESRRQGQTIRLDVHHADSNRWNNSPENLQTLCHACHMKWHHAHGLTAKAIGRMPTDWLDATPPKKSKRGPHRELSQPEEPRPDSLRASIEP